MHYGNSTDIKSLCTAAITYYKLLQQHCNGELQLPEESIKFFSERLLENVLLIEKEAKNVYDSFSDEEKEFLEQQEELRNRPLYFDSAGFPLKERESRIINTCLTAANERYDSIREEAEERVNDGR